MSKQSQAKDRQGYTIDQKVCSTCKHCKSTESILRGAFRTYVVERSKRCGLGGFAVKKTATCNLWEKK